MVTSKLPSCVISLACGIVPQNRQRLLSTMLVGCVNNCELMGNIVLTDGGEGCRVRQ